MIHYRTFLENVPETHRAFCYQVSSPFGGPLWAWDDGEDREIVEPSPIPYTWDSKYRGPETPVVLPQEAEEMLSNALGVGPVDDEIRRPNHYILNEPAHECFDVLEQCKLMGNHPVATAFAYLWRCMLKGQYSKDIRKAAYWLEKAIERDEASNHNDK